MSVVFYNCCGLWWQTMFLFILLIFNISFFSHLYHFNLHNKTFSAKVILKDNISLFNSSSSISAQVFRVQTQLPHLHRSLILITHNWRALSFFFFFLFAPRWHFESCDNQVEPNDSGQGKCCPCRTRRSPNGSNLAPPWADYYPFFRQGAGGRYCCAERQRTLGNLLFPSAPPPPPQAAAAARNQAAPGLRRTEAHSFARW